MSKEPFPYQYDGAAFLASIGRGGLHDEPGLGKTAQAIVAADKIGAERLVVVCPANVRSVWHGEFREFSRTPYKILRGVTIQDLNYWRRGKGNVFLLSYEMAAKWAPALTEFVDLMIFDEAHYLKSPDTQRVRSILGRHCDGGFAGDAGLASYASNAWFLTGTPMPNDPLDLWPFLRYTGATDLTRNTFAARYFTTYDGKYGSRQTPKQTMLPELKGILGSVAMRRTLASVDIQLPDIFLTTQTIDGDAADILSLLRQHPGLSEAVASAVEQGSLSFIDAQAIATLRRLVGEAKAPAAARLLLEDLANGVDKIVAFGIHRKVLDIIAEAATKKGVKWVRIDGATSDAERTKAVIAFQEDPEVRLFLGNIKAAGTGYTLTAAADTVLVESSWAPADNAQAIKRVHRIGQSRKVRARFLTLEGSIDERVNAVVARKTAAIAKIEEPA